MSEAVLTNPLRGNGYVDELLMNLTDTEVADFIEYWAWRREQFESDDNGFAAWKAGNLISAGHRELSRRRHSLVDVL